MGDTEQGYSVCHGGKVVALVHNHPSGNISPSERDMKTAAQHKLTVCVQVTKNGETHTKCYRPRRK